MSDTSEAVTIDVEDALRKVERSNREKYFLSLGCLKKGKIYNPQLKVPGDATPDYVCLPVTCYTVEKSIKTRVSETSRNEGVLCKGGGSFYIIGQVRDGSAEYLFYVDERKKKTCMIRCWCDVLQSLEVQMNGTVLNYFKVIATGTRAIEDKKMVMEMVMIYLSPSKDSRIWVPKNGLSFENGEAADDIGTQTSG